MGGNQQAKAAAVLGLLRWHYTLAWGRAGTAGLTPAEIEEKAEAARERGRESAGERGLETGSETQVSSPSLTQWIRVLPQPFLLLRANDFVAANQQATAATVLGVAYEEYTFAGGRAGTADLSPAEIEEKAKSARERGLGAKVSIPSLTQRNSQRARIVTPDNTQ